MGNRYKARAVGNNNGGLDNWLEPKMKVVEYLMISYTECRMPC